MRGKGNGGTYFYFMCRGRQDHQCDLPYLRTEKVERMVSRHYTTVALSKEFRTDVKKLADDTAIDELGSLASLKKRLGARLAELDTREDQYLDLVGEPGWPKAKLQRKLDAIQAERTQIQGHLADTGSRLEIGRKLLLAGLILLRDPESPTTVPAPA